MPIRILAYCLMPNHWHFVLWPETDDQVQEFMQWLTHTHTQRWDVHCHTSGTGHMYQGRSKSFAVKRGLELLLVLSYVERNALRANRVGRAEDWIWGSLWRRQKQRGTAMLSDWPVPRPADWVDFVNESHTEQELEPLRRSVNRGCPFGQDYWQKATAVPLGLRWTPRPRGRSRKTTESQVNGIMSRFPFSQQYQTGQARTSTNTNEDDTTNAVRGTLLVHQTLLAHRLYQR